MTRRGLILSNVAVALAVGVVMYLVLPATLAKRPIKDQIDLAFSDPSCAKSEPGLLRGSAGKQTELKWIVKNACAIDINVCVQDFSFESPYPAGDTRNVPVQGGDKFCEEVKVGQAPKTIKAKVKHDAEDGVYYYHVYLNGKPIDPMIDIVP